MNLNKVMLAGNLTRDPELKYTPNNTAVCNIGVASNRTWRDKDGQKQEEVTFVDCEAWGKTGEAINEYLTKGRPIFIEGRLKLDQWQDKEGQNRSKLKVVIDNFQFVDSKPEGGQQQHPPRRQPARSQAPPDPDPNNGYETGGMGGVSEDGLPF